MKKKKNDQFDQRETKKINNYHEEKLKEISNDNLKINNDFKLTIRKYDDDKGINALRENNKFKYENEKMKLDFENECKKRYNEQLDIIEKRRNEILRDEDYAENRKMELNLNHEYNMEEIFRNRKRDEMENNRLMEKIMRDDQNEKERIKNDFSIKQEQINNDYNIRTKEINDKFIIDQQNIKRKSKKDKMELINQRMEIEQRGKENKRKYKLEMKQLDGAQKKIEKELDNQKAKYEIDSKNKQEKEIQLIEERKNKEKNEYNKSMKQLDINKELIIKKMEIQSNERDKKMDLDKIDMERKFELEKQKFELEKQKFELEKKKNR